MEVNGTELLHYGIPGMKWGVRRTPEELGHETSSSKSAKNVSRTTTKVGGQPSRSAKLKNSRAQMAATSNSKSAKASAGSSSANLTGGANTIGITAEASYDEIAQKAKKLLSQLELPDASNYYLCDPTNGQPVKPSNIHIGNVVGSDQVMIVVSVGLLRYEYPVRSDADVSKAVNEINKKFVQPAKDANATLAGKDASAAKNKENIRDKSDIIKKTKGSGKSPSSSYTQHSDNSEDTLIHYGVIGMKWGIRRTPEELGHAPRSERKAFKKELKADSKEYRKLRREAAAAQKNLQYRSKVADRDQEAVEMAEDTYKRAISKRDAIFSEKAKINKLNAINAAEKFLDEQLEFSERSEGKKRQAYAHARDAVDKFEAFVESMNEKYGSENVKQLKKADVTTGALWFKKTVMEDGLKIPTNLATAPIIGRGIAAGIVNEMEREDRAAFMTERIEDYDRKKYA